MRSLTVMLMMLFVMLLPATAEAGKLADGFRGVAYGDASAIDTPPIEGCVTAQEAGARWMCQTTIGDASVTVMYMVDEGLFTGIFVRSSGYTNASALFDSLRAAYGGGRKKNAYDSSSLPDWTWSDGSVIGAFEFNRFSNEATFLTVHLPSYDAAKKAKEDRAKRAVDDL